jgi:predicted nucleic acid-binding protein
VPEAVWSEVVEAGENRPGAAELRLADWLDVRAPDIESGLDPVLVGLDAGELQALQLALEYEPDFVIIDERLGRRAARAMGLPVTGTVGLLLAAYRAELIDRAQVMEAVEAMTESGIRISRRVLDWLGDQTTEEP